MYKKSGPGVNGVYNQDFHKNTILIEVGGYENTTTEVLNSLLAFSSSFLEVIHE
ncbi:MAG: stage II sporulation protein P [Bacilli bacterium]|nr:stage II sporulation protein P [Bacilli bacterium]